MDRKTSHILYMEILVNDGFSFNFPLEKLNPTDGYMVALGKQYELVIPFDEFFDYQWHMEKYYDQHKELLSNPDNFLGAWYNEDDRNIYFDITQKVDDKFEALQLGVIRKQFAIYDNAKKLDIDLPEPQTAGTGYQNQSYMSMRLRQLL